MHHPVTHKVLTKSIYDMISFKISLFESAPEIIILKALATHDFIQSTYLNLSILKALAYPNGPYAGAYS